MGETQGGGRDDEAEKLLFSLRSNHKTTKSLNFEKNSELENSQHFFFLHLKLTDSKPNTEVSLSSDVRFSC